MLVVGCGNLPAGSLLLCIVSLNGSTEQVLVSFFDRLLHENYVVFRSGIVNVLGVELSIVVSKAAFALAMGKPQLKRMVVEKLKSRGAHFAAVIHPTALVSPFAHYGEGLVMFPYSKLSCNSTVGDFVSILTTPIGHDNEIGDYTMISGGCNIVRNVKIGKDVFVAAGVCIAQDVVVKDGAYIGLGSVVLKDVKAGTKVFGNPARIIPFHI